MDVLVAPFGQSRSLRRALNTDRAHATQANASLQPKQSIRLTGFGVLRLCRRPAPRRPRGSLTRVSARRDVAFMAIGPPGRRLGSTLSACQARVSAHRGTSLATLGTLAARVKKESECEVKCGIEATVHLVNLKRPRHAGNEDRKRWLRRLCVGVGRPVNVAAKPRSPTTRCA